MNPDCLCSGVNPSDGNSLIAGAEQFSRPSRVSFSICSNFRIPLENMKKNFLFPSSTGVLSPSELESPTPGQLSSFFVRLKALENWVESTSTQ